MSIFIDIVDKIKSGLSQNHNLSDVKFIDLNITDVVPNPIENVYVSIGFCNIEIKSGAFNSYIGMGNDGERYGNNAEIDLEMKIVSPRENNAGNCYKIFSRIYEELLYNENDYNVKTISCGKAKYNSDIFSFELVCKIKLNAVVGYETEDINISRIEVEKKA